MSPALQSAPTLSSPGFFLSEGTPPFPGPLREAFFEAQMRLFKVGMHRFLTPERSQKQITVARSQAILRVCVCAKVEAH